MRNSLILNYLYRATFDSFPIDWSDSLKSRRAIAELDDDVLVPVVGETSFEAPSSLSLRQSEKYVEVNDTYIPVLISIIAF